jgi:hypothetical protein
MNQNSIQILFLVIFLVFTSIVCIAGFYIIKRYGRPISRLFHEFDKKMWMTLGLGFLFFGFYLFAVTALAWILSSDHFQRFFTFIYYHKVESIYIGLTIFSFTTLTIYAARLLIKYLYASYKKN